MKLTRNVAGSALIVVVVFAVIIAAVGGAWLVLSTSSTMEAESRENKMKSHYLADTGIQVALALLISDTPPAVPFHRSETEFAGGTYAVDVEDMTNSLFRVTSTGTRANIRSVIEQIVQRTTTQLALDAAFSVQINPNAEVHSDDGGIPIRFDGAVGALSGMDHDPDGALLGDQTDAAHGVSMNTLPGEVAEGAGGVTDFDIEALDPAAQLKGSPTPTKTDSPYQGTELDVIIDYVRNRADTTVDLTSGGPKIVTVNNGDYGTPADYKAVYVNAGAAGNGITFGGKFAGYGILVVEAAEGEKVTLDMGGQSSWHGLIILKITDEYTVDEDDPANLVGGGAPGDSPHIVGGFVMYFAGNSVNWESGATALRLRGQSRLSYSSAAIKLALAAANKFSYTTVSYRVVE